MLDYATRKLGLKPFGVSPFGLDKFSPLDLPLIFFVEADFGVTIAGGDVALYEDKSPLGNDFSQGTGANRPVHNVSPPYIQFTAANEEFLDAGSAIITSAMWQLTTDWTFFCVARPEDIVNPSMLLSLSSDAGSAIGKYQLSITGAKGRLQFVARDSDSNVEVWGTDDTIDLIDNNTYIFIGVVSSGVVSIYVNNSIDVAERTNIGTLVGAMDNDFTYMGVQRADGTLFGAFEGRQSSMGAVSKAVNETERLNLLNYLNRKWEVF